MAKSKSRRITIEIAIFFMHGDETVHSQDREETLEKDLISYEDLLDYCDQFMKRNKIMCETEMYTIDQNDSRQIVRIEPSFEISAQEQVERCGALIIIVKSALEQIRRQFETQILEMRSQIYNMKELIEELKPMKENLDMFRKNSAPTLYSTRSMMEKDEVEDQIDIGILFSEPLYDEQSSKPTLPAVDFRSQISRLYLALESSYKSKIYLRCDIATIESLKHFIKYSKPKILHIACHGNAEGQLQFEDDSRATLGLQHLLKPEKMKSLLKNYTQILPEIVFVNSCHSERVGRTFFQLGVKYVVLINSQDLISDAAAQSFSENFYRNIFKGETVQDAFLSAKETVQCSHSTGCCCNHGSQEPHRQNCRYKRIERTNQKAHKDYHVPSEKCKCPMKNFNRHTFTCEWARKSLFEINEDFRFYNEATKSWEFKKRDFPDYFDRSKKELVICCCPVKERKPHSQSHKFQLLMREDISHTPIFTISSNRQTPEIIDYTPNQLLQSHQKSPNVYGRQKQLYQLLKELKEHRILMVYGKSGTGLTAFTIKGASYMMERRQADYFFFLDLYDIKDPVVFEFKFNESTKFDYKNGVVNQLSIKNQKVLLLLDNCDNYLNQAPKSFEQQLKNLMRQIPKVRIIMTIKEESLAAFQNLMVACKKFQLPPLDVAFARALLNSRMKDKTHISVGFQEFRTLVNKYEILRIPKVIESLSQTFPEASKDKITLDELQEKIKHINKGNTNQLLKGVLNNLRQQNKEAYEFLILCSQFSDGIFFDELRVFSSYDRPDFSIKVPIKKNWQDQYLYLFQKQVHREQELQIQVPKFESSISYKEPRQDYSDTLPEIEIKHSNSSNSDNDLINKMEGNEKTQSYFLEKISKDKFVVKRFIRDYVWNCDKSETSYMMRFLFLSYFSVVLDLLFKSLKRRHYFHEELNTYSCISKAGIFGEDTSLEQAFERHQPQDLTKSVQMATHVFVAFQQLFTYNQGLKKKIDAVDHSWFLVNHRHDMLRIYESDWEGLYELLAKRGNSEEKIFLCMMENLMIEIPTALKIARAEDSLIDYVLLRSKQELDKLKAFTRPDRNLVLQLKISMIEVSINFHDERNILCLLERADKLILEYFRGDVIDPKRLKHIESLLQEQKKNITLLNYLLKPQPTIYDKLKKMTAELEETWNIEPVLQAKKALLIGLLYLSILEMNLPKFHSKILEHKKTEAMIRQNCLNASIAFIENDCRKLALRAKLTAVELFWQCNQAKLAEKKKQSYEEVDKWRGVLADCEMSFQNKEYKLGGFTEIDDKIRGLKKKIKQWMWKSSSNSVVFLKSYPIISNGSPVVFNMIRRKNHYRKEIQAILSEPVRITAPAKKLSKGKESEQEEKKIMLDISAKFEILTLQKIEEETEAGCSIMFLSVDVKVRNGRVYFVAEGDMMEEQLIEVNEEFAKLFNEKLFILVLCGFNTNLALEKIRQYNKKCPIIIALSYTPDEELNSSEMDSQYIRQTLLEQRQLRKVTMIYSKRFVKKIFRSKLNSDKSNEKVRDIHEATLQRTIEETQCKKVQGYIHYKGCPDIYMEFKEGLYRDLSPSEGGYHNIDDSYFNRRVILRRWKKMHETLALLHSIVPMTKIRQSIVEQNANNDGYQEKTVIINIYGEEGSGKSYFIHQISKILIEREVYKNGVFLIDGKRVESKFKGNFEEYIKKEGLNSKMPSLEDFQKIMGPEMILIVDDFHCVKARSDARLKIFLEKIAEKRINLILVSTTELKQDILPDMKKVKIEGLDEFEVDVLAYNMLDIHNDEQVNEYERLKFSKDGPLKISDIEELIKKFKKLSAPVENFKEFDFRKNVSHI